jgi:hypothetical protein
VNISLDVHSTAFSEKRNLLNCPCLVLFLFCTFYSSVVDDAARNLNKIMINNLSLVCDNVLYSIIYIYR